MRLLGEFFEKKSESGGEGDIRYRVRKAVCGVIIRRGNEIAVLSAGEDDYHRLPGGSVEKGEDLGRALKRAILKETRCEIDTRTADSIGAVIEYRDSQELLKISYCYISNISSQPERFARDQQTENGDKKVRLEWMDLEEALAIMEKETPDEETQQFIHNRDILFLQEARRKISR